MAWRPTAPSERTRPSRHGGSVFFSGVSKYFKRESYHIIEGKRLEFCPDYMGKLVIFGDARVGKTALETHLDPIFKPQDPSEITIGVTFHKLRLEFNGYQVILQIWLMSSEDRFLKHGISRMQISGSLGAILLFDITKASSLERVPMWCEMLEERCGNIPILLVGNKVDDKQHRAVSKTRAIEIREKYNLTSYIEVSAKTGVNVRKMFELVGELMLKHVLKK